MGKEVSETARKLIEEAAQLIIRGGYNGFSYADLAERIGIRKASIHHHFPTKVDLVVAVVEQARARIRARIASFDEGSPVAMEQLLLYTGYWERGIRDQRAPFCLAAVMAAELPNLPPEIALSVRGHFIDTVEMLSRILTLGVEQGTMRFEALPAVEAETLMAAVYGAMLAARTYDDPQRFSTIVEASINRIRA